MRGFVVAHVPGPGVAHAVAGVLEGLTQRGHGFRQRRAMHQRPHLHLPVRRELCRIANSGIRDAGAGSVPVNMDARAGAHCGSGT